jgi:hypothetical protein
MRKFRRPILTVLVALICGGSLALAQTEPADPAPKPTSSTDRLFLAFAEDATLVDRQWWEGRAEFASDVYDVWDATVIRGVVAFQPWVDFEVGGTVGFGDTDASGLVSDGSGATDLDLWGKYHLGNTDQTEFGVGGVITVPTGDESAGLGSDAFGVSAFASLRHRLDRLILTGFGGVQFNGDGRRAREQSDRDGETAPMVGAGVIFPVSDRLSAVGELTFRGGRLDHDDDDSRALAGINWRVGGRGMIRAAIAAGLSDDAPDVAATVGYATQF